jgi:hypothetical protein
VIRIVAILGALLLGCLVWLAMHFFPSADRQTIAFVGAFAIAGAFAFTVGIRRPQK